MLVHPIVAINIVNMFNTADTLAVCTVPSLLLHQELNNAVTVHVIITIIVTIIYYLLIGLLPLLYL